MLGYHFRKTTEVLDTQPQANRDPASPPAQRSLAA